MTFRVKKISDSEFEFHFVTQPTTPRQYEPEREPTVEEIRKRRARIARQLGLVPRAAAHAV